MQLALKQYERNLRQAKRAQQQELKTLEQTLDQDRIIQDASD